MAAQGAVGGPPRRLTSPRNPQIVEVARLHDVRHRRARRRTLIEGPHQLGDALAGGASVLEVYALEGDAVAGAVARSAGAPLTVVSPEALRRIADTDHPRGPVAVVAMPPTSRLRPVDTVVLWDVADPGNAGAIVRSAAAFGFAVAVTQGTADLWSPKAIRAAAASQFRTTVAELGAHPLAELRSVGLEPAAAATSGGVSPEDWSGRRPVALIVGNEARGLPEDVSGAVAAISIELEGGVDSLNAAVAAGVLLHALARSRVTRLGQMDTITPS